MKKDIYQIAAFLQEENCTVGILAADLQENIELQKGDVISLLADKIGKATAEDKLSNLSTSLYDQGYIDGIRAGAQLIRLLTGEADTINIIA